jgi:reactive intermediate/imine deaminase
VPKTIITSPQVRTPQRPFSNAVRCGNTIYVAGQLPIDADGNTVGPGDVRAQTRQVLDNIRALLDAAGATLDDVLETTIYLTDIAAHGAVNDVYVEFFPARFPARTTVEVSALAPAVKGGGHPYLVEIDAVAMVGGA